MLGDHRQACEDILKAYILGLYRRLRHARTIVPDAAQLRANVSNKNANYMSDEQFEYCDVFDPVVQQKMRKVIQYEIGKQAGNSTLIGFYWTDTPQWDLERAHVLDWVSMVRELPAGAPGKVRYEHS